MTSKNFFKEHISVIREAHARLAYCKEFNEIIKEAHLKMVEGEKEYGVFDPKTNLIDLFQSKIEEYTDIINYSSMEIRKIRSDKRIKGETYHFLIDQLIRSINNSTMEIIRLKQLRKMKEVFTKQSAIQNYFPKQ